MKLLAIETAFEACSVALWLDGQCEERFETTPRGHAGHVLPWVEELLAGAQLGIRALDAIAFSQGPGSFTSLRIGISVVQGLTFGADLPVAPVSSLQATAQCAGLQRALVVMDARMQEVFAGAYEMRDGLASPVQADALLLPGQVSVPGEGDWSGIGNGFERFPELTALGGQLQQVQPQHWPRASAVALLAAHWLEHNPGLPAEQAEPTYLRDKVADKLSER
jgi:tRNA threonylcarbamoyladenosine biosynthesis protein TsaB